MNTSKNNLLRFFVWLRNGFCFGTAWLMLLAVVYCRINGVSALGVSAITDIMLFSFGGALLFSLWFSPFPFRKMSFIARLSGFFPTFAALELLFFYSIGLFSKSNTTLPTALIFIGIVLALYLCCILLDRLYYKKTSKKYNESLKKYQTERRS